ncbi:MAG: glycosyltransferase [Burkholderiales bacterium]|nr:glycosyltransferase [Burkholderiales bacterium]
MTLRILHVVPSYLPARRYGGPIASVHGLCKALAAQGHRVEVFTTNVDGEADSAVPVGEPVEMEGVRVWYFPSPRLRRLYWSPQLGRELDLRVRGFDLVHLHSIFLWPTLAAGRAARRHGVPYVASPRGMLVEALIRRKNPMLKRAWIALVERANLEGAALVHVTSRIEAEEAHRFPFYWPPMVVVPNGIDAGEGEGAAGALPGGLPAAGPLLLIIGRISWKKGIDRLIAALPGMPGIPLAVAGNDDENHWPALEKLASERGVGDRVHFVGPAYGPMKNALFARCSMVVLPSHSENFGNVVLEAMAAGRAVVVTPEVGAADLVREADAGLVCSGEPEPLAAAIRGLLADPARLARMGENGRRFARARMMWPAVAAQMERAYQGVIRDRGSRA